MPAKSMELKHTIALIRELDKEISEVESAIDKITSQMDSPIFTIPGIGRHMGAMILAEVGDFPTLQAQTSCWLMLDSLHLHISQGNCKLLCSHGKAWLQIFAICSFQCRQICLPLVSYILGLS